MQMPLRIGSLQLSTNTDKLSDHTLLLLPRLSLWDHAISALLAVRKRAVVQGRRVPYKLPPRVSASERKSVPINLPIYS